MRYYAAVIMMLNCIRIASHIYTAPVHHFCQQLFAVLFICSLLVLAGDGYSTSLVGVRHCSWCVKIQKWMDHELTVKVNKWALLPMLERNYSRKCKTTKISELNFYQMTLLIISTRSNSSLQLGKL